MKYLRTWMTGVIAVLFAGSALASNGLWDPVLNLDAPQKHVTVVFDSEHGCDPSGGAAQGKAIWYRVDASSGVPCYGPSFADEYLIVRITDEGLNFIADILKGILTDETILAFADSLIKLFTDQDTRPITPDQINATTPQGHPLAGWLCREGVSPAGATISACAESRSVWTQVMIQQFTGHLPVDGVMMGFTSSTSVDSTPGCRQVQPLWLRTSERESSIPV